MGLVQTPSEMDGAFGTNVSRKDYYMENTAINQEVISPAATFLDVQADARLEDLLEILLPEGYREGSEYIARNPRRNDDNPGSFTIHIGDGDKRGVWKDFALNDASGRGCISLIAYLNDCSSAQATTRLKKLLENLKPDAAPHKTTEGATWVPVAPVPNDAPDAPDSHYALGTPTQTWAYRDAEGRLLCWVRRFDTQAGGKEFRPQILCRNSTTSQLQWRWRGLNMPRPLYGLDRLAARPEARVFVCEGEKAADAAGRLLPDDVAITSSNGASGAKMADWSALAGRTVIIWPDSDDAGAKYALEVQELLRGVAESVAVMDLGPFCGHPVADGSLIDLGSRSLASGWDAADAEQAGWTPAHVREAMKRMPALVELDEHAQFLRWAHDTYTFVLYGGTIRRGFYLQEYTDHTLGTESSTFALMTKNTLLELHPKPAHLVGRGSNARMEPIIKQFIASEKRRVYEKGITFDPGDCAEGYYNLFKGFPVAPAQGDCSRFWDHVEVIICAGNATLYTYMRKWMAHLFQRPTELPGVAPVLRGTQGLGKGVFVQHLGRLVGPHFVQVTQAQHLLGKFNMHQANKLLVFADEAVWGGDKKQEGVLKGLITEPHIQVEPKGVDVITMRSYRRFIFASNADWAVARDHDDRRFLVLDVSDARKQDLAYFAALDQQMKAGGYEALMYDLLHEDLDGFRPQKMPQTSNGFDLKLRSCSVLQWLYSTLDAREEHVWFGIGDGVTPCEKGPDAPAEPPSSDLIGQYRDWCKLNNERPLCDAQFWRKTRHILQAGAAVRRQTGMDRCRYQPLPPMRIARTRLETYMQCDASIWTEGFDM